MRKSRADPLSEWLRNSLGRISRSTISPGKHELVTLDKRLVLGDLCPGQVNEPGRARLLRRGYESVFNRLPGVVEYLCADALSIADEAAAVANIFRDPGQLLFHLGGEDRRPFR
jgi:hypothetical protein